MMCCVQYDHIYRAELSFNSNHFFDFYPMIMRPPIHNLVKIRLVDLIEVTV